MESTRKGKTYRIPIETDFILKEISDLYNLPRNRTLVFIINRYYRYLVKKGKIASIEEKVK